ncbi:hypothetical protein Tco_0631831 [Tanacetum coccineum]
MDIHLVLPFGLIALFAVLIGRKILFLFIIHDNRSGGSLDFRRITSTSPLPENNWHFTCTGYGAVGDSGIGFREEFRDGIGPSNDLGENSPPVTIHTWLERFNKQNPHSFDNAAAPKEDAENRIIVTVEEIFNVFKTRDSGECRHAARNCFKYGQTGHLQQDDKKDTATSTSGHADKETRCIRPCLYKLTANPDQRYLKYHHTDASLSWN